MGPPLHTHGDTVFIPLSSATSSPMKHLSCYGHLTDLGPNGSRREGEGKAGKTEKTGSKEEGRREGGKIEKEVEKEELYF